MARFDFRPKRKKFDGEHRGLITVVGITRLHRWNVTIKRHNYASASNAQIPGLVSIHSCNFIDVEYSIHFKAGIVSYRQFFNLKNAAGIAQDKGQVV
jgi:hypothetical protein